MSVSTRRWFWLPLLLLAWQFSWSASGTALADPAAVPEEAADDEDSRFMRVVRDDRNQPLSMDTAVVTYVPKQQGERAVQVDLVGVVHVGEKAYYEALNKLFEQYDVVLYELVAPEGTRIEPGEQADRRNPLGMLQGGMKDILRLEHQLEHIDYTKENFVHADMTPEQFAESMAARGESFMSMFFRAMGQSMAQQGQQRGGVNDADILIALFARDRHVRLKRIMAEQFEDLELAMSAISGPDGSTIIEDRNDVALKVLREQIEQGKQRIAVFYGAGHLPDMQAKLLEDFGLRREGVRWFTAWDLTGGE